MKEINPTQDNSGCETSNGNSTANTNETEAKLEDINKNDMSESSENVEIKNGSSPSTDAKEELRENGNDETVIRDLDKKPEETKTKEFVPKYKYSADQWSPINVTGKKCYDPNFLMQIKDDPRTKDKPDIPQLEICKLLRRPLEEPTYSINLANIRPTSDALFPNFAKTPGSASKTISRDGKRDGRNMSMGRNSARMMSSPSAGTPMKPNVIRMSLSLREDVKLNESENAWKPTRFTKENLNDEEKKAEEVSKKFRSILNKLTPQKFDTLVQKVKQLEINTQKRLQNVIDLVFEKAIEEPNFSEVYAALCNKLSHLVVPSEANPEQSVNFRVLIINKCQFQFMTKQIVEEVAKLEKECAACTDPAKKKELQLQINEENRKIRMRSVGNVRFIGELYKLKMLNLKIMLTCINHLLENAEEEKLECLCKLLTTIGRLVETEVEDGRLNLVFKNMQKIVDQKTNKISSRVRFMIQDVIELRRRQWVKKGLVDVQPKMMDQIQKEAEQQHRQTELLNAMSGPGGYRKDDSRGKRGDNRRHNQTPMMDAWKVTKTKQMPFDASKMKVVTDKNIDYNSIKLRPGGNMMWGHGSGAKSASASPIVNVPTVANKFSILDDTGDSPGNKAPEIPPNYYSKGASIERSTFSPRGELAPTSKSGSVGVPQTDEVRKPLPEARSAVPQTSSEAAQVPISKQQANLVTSLVEESLNNSDPVALVEELKERFEPESHAGVVTAVLNCVLEKSAKVVPQIAESMLQLVSNNIISPKNYLAGLVEIFEFAPDFYIDIPMLYNHLSAFLVPHIEKKHITFQDILKLSGPIISVNQGHLLLKCILNDLKDSMGPTFVKTKWLESTLKLSQWMPEDQVSNFVTDNKLEYLEGDIQPTEEAKKLPTPGEAESKLLQLMNSEESCECIRGWVKDNIPDPSEDWFMRSLIKALCRYALFGPETKSTPHFNQDRMNKYSELIQEFGKSKTATEASCLFGVQQLVHQLEHPQGLTLEIFQYLHEQYIISLEGFIEWEESDLEPEGKAVMLKALTSFFTSIKEVDNDDSLSED